MKLARLLMLALIVVTVTGCSVNPVTGKRQLNFYSEEDEVAMGAEADPAIKSQYGELDDPEIQAYVKEIGARMVPVSHRPNLDFHFTVLDDPIVNAFALPGGYCYVTRGILGYLNSEAALAGVMGHEVGHVTAQHGVTKMSGQSMLGLGLAVGSAVAADIPFVNEIAGTSAQLLFLKYGRDDERQSDELGVQYATAIGYDTHEMAEFFQTLDR
jgi:predicted Zn-dependent protease